MRVFLVLGLAALLAACDRTPIAPVGTELLIADPDLSVVRLERSLRVRLVPNGPSGPLTLRIRDKEIPYDSVAGAFVYDRTLDRGLNTFDYTVTDESGTVRADTFYVVHLPAEIEPVVSGEQGVARAGAAAAPIDDGARAVVTGGIGRDGAALATFSRIRPVGAQVSDEALPLREARAYHTASPVAGGVLLLGGARTVSQASPADYVTSAEWIAPDGTTQRLALDEAGPRRAGHGAKVVERDGRTYVYLFGGQTPGASVSTSVDVYEVAQEDGLRLTRLSPEGGASGFAPLAFGGVASTGPASVAGFGLEGGEAVSVRSDWRLPGTASYPFSLVTREAAPLATPRTAASAVALGDGLVLVAGGRDASGEVLGSFEVYAAAANRTFRFPDAFGLFVPRAEATATIFGGTRIVVSGGRPSSGSPIVAYEVFSL